jgi:hypothetical protein
MIPQKLAITSITEGDTWDGIPSLTVTINGAAPASALSIVTMRFAKIGSEGEQTVELTSATAGQINITNAATWTITVPAQIVPGLTAGKWTWRMRFQDAAGKKRTYLADEITVLETV